MSKKGELSEELSRITEIFFNAKENFNYCFYLHKPDTKAESEYLDVDRDLKFIRHSLWRLTIIELAKLFSKKENDRFNLRRFLSKLPPNGYYGGLKISQEKIAEWETLMLNQEKTIDHVLILRDKIYAHTD